MMFPEHRGSLSSMGRIVISNIQIGTLDVFMQKKELHLLKTSISLTKHLNKQICVVSDVLHI